MDSDASISEHYKQNRSCSQPFQNVVLAQHNTWRTVHISRKRNDNKSILMIIKKRKENKKTHHKLKKMCNVY